MLLFVLVLVLVLVLILHVSLLQHLLLHYFIVSRALSPRSFNDEIIFLRLQLFTVLSQNTSVKLHAVFRITVRFTEKKTTTIWGTNILRRRRGWAAGYGAGGGGCIYAVNAVSIFWYVEGLVHGQRERAIVQRVDDEMSPA